MNRKNDLIQIEEAYNSVIGTPPGKAAAKQQLKPGKSKDKTWASMTKNIKNIPVGNDKTTQGFVHNNSGPAGADNFKSVELDPNNPAIKDDNLYAIKQSSEEGADTYFKDKSKKIARENINTSMAKNKSIFDRLYEEVMDDEQFDAVELGVGGDEDAGGDEFGGGEDQVTITLDKDLAQKLHEVLMDVLGGEEDLGDEGEDMGEGGEFGDDSEDEQSYEEMEEDDTDEDEQEDEDEDEENFNYFGEEIEAEDLGHPLVNQKKGHATSPKGKENVVKSTYTSSVGSKGGDGKVTDTVSGNGKAPEGKATSPKGSANVVKSKIKGGNQEFFQKNS